MTNAIAIALGSNLGDREANIQEAVKRLSSKGFKNIKLSSLFHSEPWDCPDDAPDYINAAFVAETDLAPEDCLECCIATEEEMGRPRERAYHESRLIDIDLLLYNDMIMQSDNLIIPHPEICNRDFVLIPLAEVAPNWQIPGYSTVNNCLRSLKDDQS